MIYRVDYLPENKINPITGQEYDSSWIVFSLTCSVDNLLWSSVFVTLVAKKYRFMQFELDMVFDTR